MRREEKGIKAKYDRNMMTSELRFYLVKMTRNEENMDVDILLKPSSSTTSSAYLLT